MKSPFKKTRQLEEIKTLCTSLINEINGKGPVVLRIENVLQDKDQLLKKDPVLAPVIKRWIAEQIYCRVDELDETITRTPAPDGGLQWFNAVDCLPPIMDEIPYCKKHRQSDNYLVCDIDGDLFDAYYSYEYEHWTTDGDVVHDVAAWTPKVVPPWVTPVNHYLNPVTGKFEDPDDPDDEWNEPASSSFTDPIPGEDA